MHSWPMGGPINGPKTPPSAGAPRLRGYGRPAQSLDLHLSADAITKRLSAMTDAELAALEARMIAAAPIVLEATADVSDNADELPDGEPGWR